MKPKLLYCILLTFSLSTTAEQPAKSNTDAETTTPKPTAALQPISPFHPILAGAGKPPTPEQMRVNIKRAVAYQTEQTKARLKAFSTPEMARHYATFSRAYYEALIKAGFKKGEALQIVVSAGTPDFR